MAARLNPSPRKNRSYNYANDDELKKISFVVTFGGLLNSEEGALLVGSLPPAARRILLFFISLNRAFRCGYRGTRSTQRALADAVAHSTSAGCSVRTLQRGLKALISAGLLVETWWNLYTRAGELVKYQRYSGEWETTKIRIYSLTPYAISLWSSRRSSRTSSKPSPSRGAVADISLPVDYCDKMTHYGNSSPSPLVPGRLYDSSDTSTDLDVTINDEVHVACAPCALTSPPSRADGLKAASRAETAKSGPTCEPPPTLHRGWARTRKNVRLLLLAHIYQFLKKLPSREADCLFAVAREETRSDAHRLPLSQCVDWWRLLASWPHLDRGERWALWRRDILPGLRAAALASPPDIAAAEKAGRRMAYLDRRMSGDAARFEAVREAERDAEREENQPSRDRDEKRARLADYAARLKVEVDPIQRELLASAINALLASIHSSGRA